MFNLVSTSDKIQLVSTGTTTLDVHATYTDWNGATPTPIRDDTNIVTATTTDVVVAPGSGVSRVVEALHIRNLEAIIPQTLIVQHTDGTTTVELFRATISADGWLTYLDGEGWALFGQYGFEE